MKKPAKVDAFELSRRVLAGLGPYREELVLIGGLARDRYRNLPGFADPGLSPPATNDVDFAIRSPLQVLGGRRLHDLLLSAGLTYSPRGGLEHRTTGCVYYPSELSNPRPTDTHLEFVAPLRGPERDANTQPQQDNLFAFALRFIDLLLDEPVVVDDPLLGRVRIPHPLAYIIQKTRIRGKRDRAPDGVRKMAKDQADAFFVIVSLQAVWPQWRERWSLIRGKADQRGWLRDTQRTWDDIYRVPLSPGTQEVAAAYPAFPAERVCRIMEAFRAAVEPD